MKNLIKMVKGTDKLGYKLSAICGVNWLISQAFKWQYLFFCNGYRRCLYKRSFRNT